ncbi:hypothetical protein [Nonomuraea sp. NPDC049158]|uniref:hypothetical protein n=1 Tax=Nonomuraea sp. NPDC049158 TaxID=3155649 RepID=UPI0033E0CF6B
MTLTDESRSGRIIAVLAFGGMVVSMMLTLVAAVIPKLPELQVWQIVLASMVISSGTGLAYAAMPASIMAAVPPTQTGAANGLNSLMRAIGTSTASAVISTMLAAHTIEVNGAPLPSHTGLSLALVITSASAVVALVITVFLPGRRAADRQQTTEVRPAYLAATEQS